MKSSSAITAGTLRKFLNQYQPAIPTEISNARPATKPIHETLKADLASFSREARATPSAGITPTAAAVGDPFGDDSTLARAGRSSFSTSSNPASKSESRKLSI
jgi:hypothetical protein